tara:strand:+ start:432 stop:716 length:285 start_codon:yes stop_codon:yes gene_type:complete
MACDCWKNDVSCASTSICSAEDNVSKVPSDLLQTAQSLHAFKGCEEKHMQRRKQIDRKILQSKKTILNSNLVLFLSIDDLKYDCIFYLIFKNLD